MADTIYLGTGKTVDGKFGTFYNVTISLNKIKENPQVVEEYKGNKYIRLRISQKKEADKFGKNVSVVWNDGKPKQEQQQETRSVSEVQDGLPF